MKAPLRNGSLRLGVVAVAAMLALVLPSAAQALPDGYAYEKVSPADKGNGEVAGGQLRAGLRAAEEGDRILYPADGVFAGAVGFPQVNTFAGARDADGWSSRAISGIFPYVVPTGSPAIPGVGDTAPQGVSADGAKTLLHTNRDPETGELIPAAIFLVDLVSGDFARVSSETLAGDPEATVAPGGTRSSVGGTADFSSILFSSDAQLAPDAVAPGIDESRPKLYRYADGELELASYLPDGTPHTALLVDSVASGPTAGRNGVSADGQIYWWTPGSSNGPPRAEQLFRGEAGLQESSFVNESENTGSVVPPGPAQFAAASSDGERAVFSSRQLLTDDSGPLSGLGRHLYLYTHSDDPENDQNLTLLTTDAEPADGEDAGVENVLGVSMDARTVYFTSTGQLVNGEPTSAGIKLYRWSESQGLEYLTTTDNAEPFPPGATPTGKLVAFRSSGAGITTDDNGGFEQVYVYNADDGNFACASCAPGSANQHAVDDVQNYNFAQINKQPRRMVSDDGRVIFTTADRLLDRDTNGKKDVYTYNDGQLDLVSSGRATSDVRFADATADGSRIYFVTRAQLTGWDTDTKADLYVARIGDGLPEPSTRPEQPCIGDDCQGPSPAAPSDEIGSSSFHGVGNEQASTCSKAEHRAKQAKRRTAKANKAEKKAKRTVRKLQRKAKKTNGKSAKRLHKRAGKQRSKAKRMQRKQRRSERAAERAARQLRDCERGEA